MSARRSRANSSDNPDEDNARKKERLDTAIFKLKEKKGGFSGEEDDKPRVSSGRSRNNSKGDTEMESTLNFEGDSSEIIETLFSESEFQIIPKDEILNLNYCMWENSSNVCWLDASMALLAHNQTLRYEADLKDSSTHVSKIIKLYNEAICLLNDDRRDWTAEQRLEIAKKYLTIVQVSSLEYLQPILKYNSGDPESAFCSLFNLIREDKNVKKYFEVKYTKTFLCEMCGMGRNTTVSKSIITLPKVVAFQPSSPCFVSECPSCKDQEQRIHVSYKCLPKCLIFHFENGAGKGELCPLDFAINGREYKVTGLMTLEKSEEMIVDHFVSWIRDPVSDFWLECNDLNPDILKFTAIPSDCINLEEVCMIMFETFDDLGIVEIKTEESDSTENLNLEDEEEKDENIPFIDLSQDVDESNNRSSRETLSRKMYGERNMPVWTDGDDLKFLNSICDYSPTKIDSDLQPHSFMKQLDLKPKTEESAENPVLLSEDQPLSDGISKENDDEKNNTSPVYTHLIRKLAAQNYKEDNSTKLPSLDINHEPESKTHNIVINATEKSPLDQNLSCSVEADEVCNKLEDNNGSFKKGEKLVTSSNYENSQSSSTDLIESDFLKQQHDKLNQILASKKGTLSKIKFPTLEKADENTSGKEKNVFDIKNANKHQKQTGSLFFKEKNNNSEKTSDSDINGELIKNPNLSSIIQSKISEIKNETPSSVSKNTRERPPFPIEVKATIIDINDLKKDNYQDSVSTCSGSMPIFPVAEGKQINNIKNPKEDKSDSTVSNTQILLKEAIKKTEQKELESDCDAALKFNDFLFKENSYNEMSLIVKESEEITPENIIKVIRNEKSTNFSKTSIFSAKRKKTKVQRKDFANVKITPCSINVARLTPKEILQYSPGTVFNDSTPCCSPNSTSTNLSSPSCKFGTEVYQEDFDDVLKVKSSNQKPCSSGINKRKKGKYSAKSNEKKGNSLSLLDSSQKTGKEKPDQTNRNASTVNTRGRCKKETVNTGMGGKTKTLIRNNQSVQDQAIDKTSSIASKTRSRKKKHTVKLTDSSAEDHFAPKELIKKESTSESDKDDDDSNAKMVSKMLSCEVGKKWGKKEMQPVLKISKLGTVDNENKSPNMRSALVQNASPLEVHKRKGRQKTDLNITTDSNNALQDQKIIIPVSVNSSPSVKEDSLVRKSTRRRADALASMKEDFVVDSNSKLSSLQNLKQNDSITCSKIPSPDVKNTIKDNVLHTENQKSQRRKRSYYQVLSTSDSDVNIKSEVSIGEKESISMSKKINAISSCTSASEAEFSESANTRDLKGRRKRKVPEKCLPISKRHIKVEFEVKESKSNAIKVTSPSIKNMNNTLMVKKNSLSVVQSGMHYDNKEMQSPQKNIKSEAILSDLSAHKNTNILPNDSKKSRKRISSEVSNSNYEASVKKQKTKNDSNIIPKKSETTPRNKGNIKLKPSPLNQDLEAESPFPYRRKITIANLDIAVDCIIDYYLSKTYSLFGVGCEE